MIIIENNIISDEIVESKFVCDLARCKGGCCEEGDAGAPLEKSEKKMLEKYYPDVKPLLLPESVAVIEKEGFYINHEEFGDVTPTLDDNKGLCVYAYKEPNGIIKCAFEKLYNEGKIGWKKPISCHLFPIIVYKGKYGDYDKVNYYPRETLCKPACRLGEKLKIPVYKFLKEPIIRKFGQEFYDLLDSIAKEKYST